MESQKSSFCSSPAAHYHPKIPFQASGALNFETDNNLLRPGQDCMVGDLTARTCTHE